MPTAAPRALRVWPGVAIVAVQWLARFGLPLVVSDSAIYGVLTGIAGGPALLVWWLFFSRAPWTWRVAAPAVMALAVAAAWPFLDISLATGAMGFIFPMLAMPGLCLAFVLWAVLSQQLVAPLRWAMLTGALVLAAGGWTLVRTGGFTGSFDNDLAWRWTPTAEDRLVAQEDASVVLPATPPAPVLVAASTSSAVAAAPTVALPAATTPSTGSTTAATADGRSAVRPGDDAPDEMAAVPVMRTAAEWPGFRGPHRDSVVRGAAIETDWTASPPVELWRRQVGPGWSSFAVHGDVFYTQEQRGEEEVVAAYRVGTGQPVWRHRDRARFWESNGGAGPRGTPTLGDGRVYAFGATGILNVLDERDGRVIWSRNVPKDTGVRVPDWGFASSPLLVDDLVVIAAAGKLIAYERASGTPRWNGPAGGPGYSSPHLWTSGGVSQILLLHGGGVSSISPVDGRAVWERQFSTSAMSAPIVQPAFTSDGDVLIGDGTASGMRRVSLAHDAGGWTIGERWWSTSLKPLFNDFVVHNGHAFGFDGSIMSCIDLADGSRKWKGGRYGNGQVLLLANQDVLLVLSEEGRLALVAADSGKFTELSRAPALQGKTWNHPVLIGDVLLVRNGEAMAAFRLAMRKP